MKKKLIFNGVSSIDLGLVIQTAPSRTFPERDVDSTHIPGRNGDIFVDNKCYKNVKREYSLAKGFFDVKHLAPNAQTVLAWLTSAKGKYVRLEDDYDPDVYRLAMYNESGSFTDFYDKALSILASFECKPQRFLKEGDEPVFFNSNEAHIINPSHYEALPLIRITGIPYSLSDVVMLTVKDKNNENKSNLTISDVSGGIINIDSEEQNCYYDNGDDANDKIGLNGKNFPSLTDDKNTLVIEKFEKEAGNIGSYSAVISDNQILSKSEYKDYDALETSKQNKVLIKAYKSMINAKRSSYDASSYQAYIMATCENGLIENNVVKAGMYTFKSFNDMLDEYGDTRSFSGTIADNSFPDWLIATESGGIVTLTSAVTGFFMSTNSKKIKRLEPGDVIDTYKSDNGTMTVTYYEADSVDDEKIKINYDDIPDWVNFVIEYDENGSPNKLSYKTKVATGQQAYYWTDKSWIFGKSKWSKLGNDQVLNELTWNNIKKAFMSSSSLSLSKSISLTYYYLKEPIQYIDTETEKTTFTISNVSSSLDTLNIYAKKAGYYLLVLNDDSEDDYEWKSVQANANIEMIKGTDAFKIYYLESIPNYSEEKDWPEWLNSTPIPSNPSKPLNSTSITFEVLKDSKYRYSYLDNSSGESVEKYSEWEDLENGDEIPGTHPTDTNFYICQIDAIPETYLNDRAFTDASGTISENPPSWLLYKAYIKVALTSDSDKILTCYRDSTNDDATNGYFAYKYTEDDTDVLIYVKNKWAPDFDDPIYGKSGTTYTGKIGAVTQVPTIEYYAYQNGYFKWDNNSAWVKKLKNDMLLSTNYKDNTTFFYMSALPSYSSHDMSDLIQLVPVEDSSGNPIEVKFVILTAGYYRVNSNVDWKYYEVGDTLYTATINATTVINYLDPSDDTLDNITITITPRWWML